MEDSKLWPWLDRSMSALSPRNRSIAMVVDALAILACWQVTYLFRLGFERWQPGRAWYDDYVSFGVALTYLVCLAITGVPRGLWRYFGFDDFKRIAAACLLAGMASAVVVLMAHLSAVARAVLVLHPLFCITTLSLMRMGYRMVWEHAHSRVTGIEGTQRRAIVLGSGDEARRLVLALNGRDGWSILALLDDDPAKRGLRIGGVTVQGGIGDLLLPHVLAGATHVLVALPAQPAEQRQRALELARRTGLTVMSVPVGPELEPDVQVAG